MRQKTTISEEVYALKLADKGLDERGREVPSPVPIAPPIGYKRQPSMVEIVRNMVRSEKLAEEARNAGLETFEESEDFDVGDEPEDLTSGFENDFDPPIAEVRKAVAEEKTKITPKPASVGDKGAAGGSPGAEAPSDGS